MADVPAPTPEERRKQRLRDHIEAKVAEAPPLTEHQRRELANLLRPLPGYPSPEAN